MMPFPLYSDYFYPAFPSLQFDRTKIPPWFLEHYFMHNVLRQGRDIKRNHLNSLTRSRALLVDCFTNTTPNFFVNPHYQDQWKRFHMISANATAIPEVVNLLYEMVMYPRQPLCEIIEDHQMTLLKRFVIGVQVRIGGQQARYKDRQFLTMDDLPSFYSVIDAVMTNRTLTLDDVFVANRPFIAMMFGSTIDGLLVRASSGFVSIASSVAHSSFRIPTTSSSVSPSATKCPNSRRRNEKLTGITFCVAVLLFRV